MERRGSVEFIPILRDVIALFEAYEQGAGEAVTNQLIDKIDKAGGQFGFLKQSQLVEMFASMGWTASDTIEYLGIAKWIASDNANQFDT